MIGERLGRIEVTQPDGSTVAVGGLGNRSATILLARHDDCDRCRELRAAAAERSDKIGWWGARTIVTDADDELRGRLGLDEHEAAVLVIDRFGIVWERHTAARDGHDRLPDADALEESAKFLGTQCPECGVPDRPDTGGWAVV